MCAMLQVPPVPQPRLNMDRNVMRQVLSAIQESNGVAVPGNLASFDMDLQLRIPTFSECAWLRTQLGNEDDVDHMHRLCDRHCGSLLQVIYFVPDYHHSVLDKESAVACQELHLLHLHSSAHSFTRNEAHKMAAAATMTTSSERYNHLVQVDIAKPMDGTCARCHRRWTLLSPDASAS